MATLEMQYCLCGCGSPVLPYSDGRIRRYKKGHKFGKNCLNGNDLLETNCGLCRKSISVERWRLDKFATCFCSRKHAAQFRWIESTKIFHCEECHHEFPLNQSKKQGKHIFCSLKCAATYQHKVNPKNILTACSQCTKPIKVFLSTFKKNKHFYCNAICRKLYIIGKNNPSYRSGMGRKREYSANWKSQRRAALIRDNFTCQYCKKSPKKPRYLHVHHITPAYIFNGHWEEANKLENLITLCPTCHKKAESGKIPIQPKLF